MSRKFYWSQCYELDGKYHWALRDTLTDSEPPSRVTCLEMILEAHTPDIFGRPLEGEYFPKLIVELLNAHFEKRCEMSVKEKRLAAQLLQAAADHYGRHSCNDWEYPHDWTADERVEFCRAYHAWNGDPQDFNPEFLHLPDFAVMAFLASGLYCESETVRDAAPMHCTCTCGEPHISQRIAHRYDGKPCYVKDA